MLCGGHGSSLCACFHPQMNVFLVLAAGSLRLLLSLLSSSPLSGTFSIPSAGALLWQRFPHAAIFTGAILSFSVIPGGPLGSPQLVCCQSDCEICCVCWLKRPFWYPPVCFQLLEAALECLALRTRFMSRAEVDEPRLELWIGGEAKILPMLQNSYFGCWWLNRHLDFCAFPILKTVPISLFQAVLTFAAASAPRNTTFD